MTVRYEVASAIATITLDRPAARNALGPDEWSALHEAVLRAGGDRAVRVVKLTGAPGAFSAGGDLRTMPERLALPPAERRARLCADAQAIRALRELARPVVARIDGACVGAGLSLALACDLRLCSSRSTFAASFVRVGLASDFGALHLLPRAVGMTRATELLLLGDTVEAAEAAAIGLVHAAHPVERFDAAVDALCERLASAPTAALALIKAGLNRAPDLDLSAAIEWEAAAQALASRTDDAREGVAAALEKRPPRFTGY